MNRRTILVIETDGTERRFSTLEECGCALGMSLHSVWKRIHGRSKTEKRIFKYEFYDVKLKPTRIPKTKSQGYKEKPFEPRCYKVVEYETNGSRVCITPCRFMRGVKIGSAGCQGCRFFKGRERVKHLVACAHKGNDIRL